VPKSVTEWDLRRRARLYRFARDEDLDLEELRARLRKMTDDDCELSVGVRKSKTVALRHPVMPVSNGFRGRVVGINSRQL
jgi:hypothetical protein